MTADELSKFSHENMIPAILTATTGTLLRPKNARAGASTAFDSILLPIALRYPFRRGLLTRDTAAISAFS